MTEQEALKQIKLLQDIQKTHPPTTSAWMQASELLAPLFERMAEFQKQALAS